MILDLPFDLVINGISAGLSGSAEIELNEHILNTNGACYDLIYGAQENAFFTDVPSSDGAIDRMVLECC